MNDITKPIPPKPLPKPVVAKQPVVSPVAPPVEEAASPPLGPVLPEKPKSRRWLKWVVGIAAGLLLLVAITFGVGYFVYQQALQPKSGDTKNISVQIPPGASTEEIANILADKGVVQTAWATQLYMRLNGGFNIKAGHYELSPNESVQQILEWLTSGRTDTLKVTILPGRTLSDLKKDLAKYGFNEVAIETALTKTYNHPLLKDKPAGANLEGYIFPETYFMESAATPEDIVLRSFDEFELRMEQEDMVNKLAAKGFNIHQGVTLASIVGAEVSGPEDRRKVAQVFEKRLKEGMVLGSDVTYVYAAKQLGVPATPDLDSPYNTRRVPGLPPGAVQNFNFDAIEAVVNPANTSYLFFVAGDDGVTRYSYTFEEHEANVAKYCQKVCFSN